MTPDDGMRLDEIDEGTFIGRQEAQNGMMFQTHWVWKPQPGDEGEEYWLLHKPEQEGGFTRVKIEGGTVALEFTPVAFEPPEEAPHTFFQFLAWVLQNGNVSPDEGAVVAPQAGDLVALKHTVEAL